MTTDQVASAESTHVPPRRVRPLVLVAVIALAADVVSKVVAVATLENARPVRLLGGLLYLRLIRNPGAAFSFGTGVTWVFSLVMIAVSVAIVWLAFRLRHTGWAVGLGLVLAGALGNLTDRLFRGPGPFRGHVVDFISLFSPNGHPWPIFNIADACINVGGAIIVIIALRGINYDGSRRDAREKSGEAPAAEARPKPAVAAPPAVQPPPAKSRAEEAADKVRALARARAEAPTMRVPPVPPAAPAQSAPPAPSSRSVQSTKDDDHFSGELPAVGTPAEPAGSAEATAIVRPVPSPAESEPVAQADDAAVADDVAEGDEATTRIDLSAAREKKSIVDPETDAVDVSTEDASTVADPPTSQLHVEESPVGLLPVLSAEDDVRTSRMMAGELAEPGSGDVTGRMMAGKLVEPAAEPEPADTEDAGSGESAEAGAAAADSPAAADTAAETAGSTARRSSNDDADSAELCGVDDEATTQISLDKLAESGKPGAVTPDDEPTSAQDSGKRSGSA